LSVSGFGYLLIVFYVFQLRPKLAHQVALAKYMQIIDAVQEIVMQEGGGGGDTGGGGVGANITKEQYPWLSDEYISVARNQEKIRSEFKAREQSLNYLSGIITDLFVDYNKLKFGGVDQRAKLPALQKLIYTADINALTHYFLQGK
jgi:hypothetical protein